MEPRLSPLPSQIELSPGEVASLLDQFGTPNQLSWRHQLPSSAPLRPAVGRDTPQALQLPSPRSAAGSPTGQTLSNVLLNPQSVIDLTIWSGKESAGKLRAYFPTIPAQGDGVIVTEFEGGYRLSAFANDNTLLTLLAPLLPPATATPGLQWEALLHVRQAAVLAALIDMWSTALGHIAGTQAQAVTREQLAAIAPQEIEQHLAFNWACARRDELLGVLYALFPAASPPACASVGEELSQLVQAGQIELSLDERYQPSASLFDPIVQCAGVQAGFTWERLALMPAGLIVGEAQHVLLSPGCRAFAVSLARSDWLRMRTVDGDELRAFFASECVGNWLKTAGLRPAAALFCTACGRAFADSAHRFCIWCGAKRG